jgi:alkylated DNA repair dioxygenase AlkB
VITESGTLPVDTTLFDIRDLTGHVNEICDTGITSIPDFLRKSARKQLLDELHAMSQEEAPAVVGPYDVRQKYNFSTTFAKQSLYVGVAKVLQEHLNAIFKNHPKKLLSKPLEFNDLAAHRYPPGGGISPHRDGLKYLNIIAVLVLEGEGRFCLCDDRDGTNPREIGNAPGDLLLMRASGFNKQDVQPFHFVDQISAPRTSFALRHKRPMQK